MGNACCETEPKKKQSEPIPHYAKNLLAEKKDKPK